MLMTLAPEPTSEDAKGTELDCGVVAGALLVDVTLPPVLNVAVDIELAIPDDPDPAAATDTDKGNGL